MSWASAVSKMDESLTVGMAVGNQRADRAYEEGYRAGRRDGYNQAVNELNTKMKKLKTDMDEANGNWAGSKSIVADLKDVIFQLKGEDWFQKIRGQIQERSTAAYNKEMKARGYIVR